MIPSSLFTTADPLPFRRECIRNELFIGARTHDAILRPRSPIATPLYVTHARLDARPRMDRQSGETRPKVS